MTNRRKGECVVDVAMTDTEHYNYGHDRGSIAAHLNAAMWNLQRVQEIREFLVNRMDDDDTRYDHPDRLALDAVVSEVNDALPLIQKAYDANLEGY